MKIKKLILGSLMSISSISQAGVNCDTNCKDHSRYKYACGVKWDGWRTRVKTCTGTNYAKKSTCEMMRSTQGCSSWLDDVVDVVLENGSIAAKAERDGWTKGTCVTLATGITGSIVAFKSSAICGFMAGAGTPLAGGVCVTAVTGMVGTITSAVCVQLCHDRHLLDCGE